MDEIKSNVEIEKPIDKPQAQSEISKKEADSIIDRRLDHVKYTDNQNETKNSDALTSLEPNSKYYKDGHIFETDDNGNIYTKDRELQPNTKNELKNDFNNNEELKKLIPDYLEDLKANSEYPKTIDKDTFTSGDLEKLTPDEAARRREEFDDIKSDLKLRWEKEYAIPWPKYEHDVYSANGKLIRKAGCDYDAHHIQPLAMGGKNEVNNISPIHAENHYDRQGIHSPNSTYSKIDRLLGGIEQ